MQHSTGTLLQLLQQSIKHLPQIKQVHSTLLTNGYLLFNTITTPLTFYGKKRCPEKSLKLFAQMDVKMVCTWNAVISSLACNDMQKAALDMFGKMMKGEFLPNEVTFVVVFTACAHGNLLDFGMKFYEYMVIDLGILPTMEHYECMVHLLGKCELLREATVLIESTPFEADSSVMGSCKIHGAIELGTKVWQKLLKIQPFQYGQYVALSSMDAEFNDWKNAIPAYSLMGSM